MTVPVTQRRSGRGGRAAAGARPRLLGLGTANPPLRMDQDEASRRLAALWGLRGGELARFRRIVAGSGIDQRHGVLPLEEVVGASTGRRMAVWEQAAPPLATEAARRALRAAGVDAASVTEVVVVTCTGFAAPGLDVHVAGALGMPPTVRRTIIGFMGCFGAIVGLRTAAAACSADPRAVVLLLCVELCSLHLRDDRSPDNLVASAIFADGAAAAVVAGSRARAGGGAAAAAGRLTPGRSRLVASGRDWMSWRITDAGFAMTLAREVPAALGAHVGPLVAETRPPPACYVVHPGGAAILDAVDAALGLDGGGGLEVARDVLRRHGNMSSATVLFVLRDALRRGHRPPALLLAFGPGLAIESLLLLPDA